MATYKHLRSSTANKRPTTSITDGQLAINTNTASPGLFFKDSAGTGIVKVGPVHVGTTAPNATPAAGGSSGNYLGEQWLDTSVSPAQMKVWNGSAWVGIVADELPVSKLQDGDARQLLQTDAAGTGVEWTSNVDVPGTLDVTGATTLDSTLTVPLGSAASPTLRFSGDANSGLYSPGADQVAVATNGTGRLFVDATGNVGVGASSPDGQLVIGNTSYSKNRPGSGAYVASSVGGDYYGLVLHNQSTASTGTVIIEGRLGQASLSNTSAGKIIFGKQGTWTTNVSTRDGYLAFWITEDAVENERLRITAAGNVGIGTTSPVAKLDIIGANEEDLLRLSTGNTPGNTFAQIRGDNESGIRIKGGGSFEGGTIELGGGLRNTDPGIIKFSTGTSSSASEAARIDSDGRLLVGTSTSVTSDRVITPQIQLAGTNQSASAVSVVNYNSGGTPSHLILGSSTGGSVAIQGLVNSGGTLGMIAFTGSDGTAPIDAAFISAEVDGTPGPNDMPGRLVFSTTADGASSPTERMRITSAGVLQIADAGNITVGTTTGTKIGTATTQKLGFYNATPVVQPAAVADATDAATVITQLNDLLAKLRTLGIIAT